MNQSIRSDIMGEPTLYEMSVSGRSGVTLPQCDVGEMPLPAHLVRSDNGMPELSELQVVRHFLRLSQRNFGVDSGFYPLGEGLGVKFPGPTRQLRTSLNCHQRSGSRDSLTWPEPVPP